MRIIHIVHNSDNGSIWGNHRHILYLAAAQRANGFDVTVITDSPGLFTKACDQQGIPIIITQRFRLLPERVNSTVANVYQEMNTQFRNSRAGLIDQFRYLRADLIHCHDEVSAHTAIAAGNESQIPCVLTLHVRPSAAYPHLCADRKFTTLSVSKAVFDQLRRNGVSETDLYYVPNGTNARASTLPEGALDTNPNLMIVGHVTDAKGIDIAILAMVELQRRRNRSCPCLNIYGDGPDARVKYFKEMAAVLGLHDIIKFHGVQLDIINRCERSNVLVVPSRSETGPLVVLEAMSRGMSIVSSDVGDVAEMLPDQRYGRIVPTNSIVVLAEAIDSALSDVANGRFDPDLLVERHREFYTVEKMAERVESVYEKVLAN